MVRLRLSTFRHAVGMTGGLLAGLGCFEWALPFLMTFVVLLPIHDGYDERRLLQLIVASEVVPAFELPPVVDAGARWEGYGCQ